MNYDKKIDLHSHILTAPYYTYLDRYEGPTPDNFATPKWTEEGHLKLMDDLGVAFSCMSVSSPHLINAGQQERIAYVHSMNEEALYVVEKHLDRLGMFITLPLPDVDAAIQTLERYKDREGVDGVGLMTNYDGIYLGSPKLDPLMEVLNEHHMVVDVHPAMPASLPGDAVLDMPIPVMDFLMDTTRAFTNMVWHDKFIQYPNIRWIWPHGASFMTILSDRFNNFAVLAKKDGNKNKLDYFGAMKHCWFDTAGFSVQKQLHCMKLDIPTSKFVYGSDCPYTPAIVCQALAGQLEETDELTDEEKLGMFTTNAIELIPRLKEILGGDYTPNEHGGGKRKMFGQVLNSYEKISK